MAENKELKKHELTDEEAEKVTGGRTMHLRFNGKTYQGEYLRAAADEYCSRFEARDPHHQSLVAHGVVLTCSECKYAEDVTGGEYAEMLCRCTLNVSLSEVTNIWGEDHKGDYGESDW